MSLPIYEEKTKHRARKGSQSAPDDREDFIPAEDRNGPSKHQQKKAAKAARRNVGIVYKRLVSMLRLKEM